MKYNTIELREFLNIDNFLPFKYVELIILKLNIVNYNYEIIDNSYIITSIINTIDTKIFQDLSIIYGIYWNNGLHYFNAMILLLKSTIKYDDEKLFTCKLCGCHVARFEGYSKCIGCNQLYLIY